jgi:hypothetical protein
MRTVFPRHIYVRNPRRIFRDIEYISDYRPWWRARWIRQPSPSLVVAEDKKEVKEKGDSKAINGVDKKGLHDGAGDLRKKNMRL